MNNLQPLLSTALIGTGRETLPTPDKNNTPLDQLLAQIDPSDKAHHLLTRAGTLAFHQQIGHDTTEKIAPPQSDLAPENSRQEMPKAAVDLLLNLCDNNAHTLLITLLHQIVTENWHIPAQHLPQLLALGRKNGHIRPHITNSLDEIGRWLARQNSEWHYALWPEQPWDQLLTEFNQGASADKLALLRWCRQQEPAQGLRLLQSGWHTLPDSIRTQLLNLLKDGLSLADEPFLEKALDDRHITVRRKAQELLAMLPRSAYAQRMIAHSHHFLRWHPRRKTPLTVVVPAEHTLTMRRDGLPPQNESKQMMYLTRRITTIVSNIPLDYWVDEIAVDIAHFLELVTLSKWTRTLINGLITAAKRQERADWAKALIDWGAGSQYEKLTLRNIIHLTPDDFTAIVTTAAQDDPSDPLDPLSKSSPIAHYFISWKAPWPLLAAETIIPLINTHLTNQHPEKAPDIALKTAVRQFFTFVPTPLTPLIENTLATHRGLHPQWEVTLKRGLKTLRFRQTLAQLSNTGVPPVPNNLI